MLERETSKMGQMLVPYICEVLEVHFICCVCVQEERENFSDGFGTRAAMHLVSVHT